MTNGTKRYVETIEWLGKLYDYVNDKLFKNQLERPVITVQTDERNKAYGWFTLGKVWKENKDDDGQYEINMSAQFLNRHFTEIANTLIHEMCHQFAKESNVQDCSRGGSYHNKLFKKIAEEHGLKVEKVDKIGWSKTSFSLETEGLLSSFFVKNPPLLIYREPIFKGARVKTSSTRKYVCPCCGNSVRATKCVNIACIDCNAPMQEE